MGGALLANCDFRPFFLRVLEFMVASGYPREKFLELSRDLGMITVDVAKRYYVAAQVTNLELAANHVCGLLSLALLKKSRGDLFIASQFILEEGLVKLGIAGWKMLLTLVELQKRGKILRLRQDGLILLPQDLNRLEREAFELISAEENTRWVGWLYFRHEFSEARLTLDKARVRRLLIEKHFAISQSQKIKHVESLIETGLLCEAAGIKFRQALSLVELRDLASFYYRLSDQALDKLVKTTEAIKAKIPSELYLGFDGVILDFNCKIVDPLKQAIKDSKEAVARFLAEKLLISDSADAGIRDLFREASSELKNKDIRDLLDELSVSPRAPEASDVYREVVRGAVIEELVKRIKKFLPQELADLLCYAQAEELTGKIKWHLLGWDMLEDVYVMIGEKNRERFFLSELMAAAKTSSGKIWWGKRTPGMEHYFRQHEFKVKTKKPYPKK